MKKHILLFLLGTSCFVGHAQVFSDRESLPSQNDSTAKAKAAEYPYLLPILGKKATAAGYSLPYSAGLGVNYLYQKSDLIINNLEIGFNNGPRTNMDNIVKFNNATATSNGINFRPDVWLFPFLNVYGIFARSQSATAIDVNIQLPQPDGGYKSIGSLQTKAEFEGTTTGFGLMPTMGIKGCWFALDMNFSWTDIPQLEKPAFIYIFGPRLGKAFKLKNEQTISVWAGGFRVKMSSTTAGSIPIGDLFDTEKLNQEIDKMNAGIDEAQQNVDTWWNTEADQSSPVDIAKKERYDAAIVKASNLVDNLDGAVSNVENASVQYSLSKKPKEMWNFLVGAQYQYNKHWMLRAECGFLGARTQVIAGLQYRFGL